MVTNSIEDLVAESLQQSLSSTAPGLRVAREKTSVTIRGRERRFLIQQAREAARIANSRLRNLRYGTRHQVNRPKSKGFFIRSVSSRFQTVKKITLFWLESPTWRMIRQREIAAGRMRRTFRSLRPLLPDEPNEEASIREQREDNEPVPEVDLVLSKSQLDEKGRIFSWLLLEQSASRIQGISVCYGLLLISGLIMNFLMRFGNCFARLEICQDSEGPSGSFKVYCLADLFRAGATETGLVPDD